MKQVVDVSAGEVKVGVGETILRSVAIGSCVAVAALDSLKRVGATAHIMLPGSAPKYSLEKTKYAFDGIEQLLNQMFGAEANTDETEVCLGGTKRKSVFLDVENGRISFIEGDEEEKTLWQTNQP